MEPEFMSAKSSLENQSGVPFSDRRVFDVGALDTSQTDEWQVSVTVLAGLLQRHACGDWGDLQPAERDSNLAALNVGLPVRSLFRLKNGLQISLVTTGDRRQTIFLVVDRA
jgi:hypothetical protein